MQPSKNDWKANLQFAGMGSLRDEQAAALTEIVTHSTLLLRMARTQPLEANLRWPMALRSAAESAREDWRSPRPGGLSSGPGSCEASRVNFHPYPGHAQHG